MRHSLIDTSTAANPTGLPTGSRLFRIRSGPFAGRLFAIYARTPAVISWTWSDPPHSAWQAPVDAVTDAADEPLAATMDDAGYVYLIYTQSATGALIALKLTFASGTWAAQTPATVYDSVTSVNRHPSVMKDLYGRLWVAWARDDAGIVTWRVKRSIDDGQTFGSGAADAGTDLSGDVTAAHGILIARGTDIHALFTTDSGTLWNRRIGLDALLWDSADSLYTGAGPASDFHAAVSPDGMLGILFAADNALWFREYDGVGWRPVLQAAAGDTRSPSLVYIAATPHSLFLANAGEDQWEYRTAHRAGNDFTSSVPALSQATAFATLLLFDADAATAYADRTAEAANDAVSDVFHPASAALLQDPGDAVYFGGEDRFSFIRVILSTVGTGGTVAWEYWDGALWQGFTPDSGAYHFDSAASGLRLFPDGNSTPATWQKTTVDGHSRYWIRAVVQSSFTTAPIATQLTAIPNTGTILPLRG